MSTQQFSAPAAPTSGDICKPADVEGHLLVIEPSDWLAEIKTQMGETDAIRVTVHDINAQKTFTDVLWFSVGLKASLRSMIGQQVLAVMGKGTAKPGQSAPWTLVDASSNADAVKAATAYMTSRQSEAFTAPALTPQENANIENAIAAFDATVVS